MKNNFKSLSIFLLTISLLAVSLTIPQKVMADTTTSNFNKITVRGQGTKVKPDIAYINLGGIQKIKMQK